jgi:hypothetical protein
MTRRTWRGPVAFACVVALVVAACGGDDDDSSGATAAQKTDGLKDAYLLEGGRMAVYKVDDPTKLGTFVQDGDLIDQDGSIGTYSDIAG